MKTQIIIPIACVAVGSAAGFMLGQNSQPEATASLPAPARAASAQRVVTNHSGSNHDGEARQGRTRQVNSLEDALFQKTQTGRMVALMDYFSKLDPSSFSEEADKLSELPMSDRMMSSLLLFSQWGETDPLSAMSYTKEMGRIGGFVNGTVLKSWASSDPLKAAEYYAENAGDFNTFGRGGAQSRAGTIAAEWASQDRAAALSWALSLEGDDSAAAVASIFNQIATNDPAEAVLSLANLSDEAAKISATNTIARKWGASDWGAAEVWISSLPADQQAEASASAIRGLSEVDHLAAADKLAASPAVAGFSDVMESITRRWSREDPASASAWVVANGSVEDQAESIGAAVSSWANVDAPAAYAFVNEQQVGVVRDAAATNYLAANRNGDTNENLALAETVTDSNSRARAIGLSVANWMKEDAEAASAYINNTDLLTDEQKPRIIQWTTTDTGNNDRRRQGRGRR